MEKLRFAELGLSAEVLKAVDKMGFEEASPIQTAVIPTLMAGHDVVGQSATGSGKTAAFGIPAIEKVDPQIKAVQVLILCPTRELAVQVAEEMAKLSFFKRGVQAVPIFGGQSYERQFRALASGVQVVIGTPGRVMDHMERGTLKLDKLAMVVLDECDRMLDMGFRDDIEHILKATPSGRQLLFFSATMPVLIKQMIQRFANEPQFIKIEAQAQNAPQVDQIYYEVERRSKIEVLTRLIDLHDFRYGIVFCSTKIMVDELDEHLHARGYAVDRLHGDITQAQRTRVMEKFKRRGFEFLIATDVAARGLDVDDLEVVFNFDLPNDAEDYTHRVGRTGRAGRKGRAFTFVSGRELWKLQSMVRYAKLKIRRENVPSLDQVEEARENVFFERLRSTLDAGTYRKQDRMVDRLLEQGYASTDVISALVHLMQGGGEKPAEKTSTAAPKSFANQAPAAPSDEGSEGQEKAAAPRAPRRVEEPAEAAPGGAPAWVAKRKAGKFGVEAGEEGKASKKKYERAARTGKEPGFTPVFFNVGRKHLVTPADIVGKIAGVARVPNEAVGAIDIHQRHTVVDVADAHVSMVMSKLRGIRMKGEELEPKPAVPGGGE